MLILILILLTLVLILTLILVLILILVLVHYYRRGRRCGPAGALPPRGAAADLQTKA